MSKFKLNIDEPCSQKWENFTPVGKNGFCSQCRKEVVDFTKFTDQEIREYFKNLPKNVCGQFQDYQLRTYSSPNSSRSLSRWLAWPIAATATLFSGNILMAQESERTEQIQHNYVSNSLSFPRLITGQVTDEYGESLPGANIVIDGTTKGCISDLDGYFELQISKPGTKLILSYIGYESKEYMVSGESEIKMVLSESDMALMGEVVLVGGIGYSRWYTPRGIWSRTRGLVRRIF